MKRMTAAAAALLFGLAMPALAQEEAGAREYNVACAICHGESGMGSGPFAELLNIQVPGLTRLAANNQTEPGVFPFLDVLMIIDGRSGVRGHGESAMPIWGDRFEATARQHAGPFGAELEVRGRLLSLVYYLESIQE